MLTFENNRISGFGSFEHKDTFKFYKCKWDKDAKNWYVPPETDVKMISKLIKKINDESTQKVNEKWQVRVPYVMCHSLKREQKIMTKF